MNNWNKGTRPDEVGAGCRGDREPGGVGERKGARWARWGTAEQCSTRVTRGILQDPEAAEAADDRNRTWNPLQLAGLAGLAGHKGASSVKPMSRNRVNSHRTFEGAPCGKGIPQAPELSVRLA